MQRCLRPDKISGMGIRFTIRSLLLLTLILGIAFVLFRLQSPSLSTNEIVSALASAGTEAYVDEFSENYSVCAEPLQAWHVEADGPCYGIRINKKATSHTLMAASAVKSIEMLTVLNLGKDVSVRNCDFRRLRNLHIGSVDNKQVCEWIAAAPNLDHLSITASEELTPETFACIGKIRWLNSLHVDSTSISKEHLAALNRSPAMRLLSFDSCDLSPGVFDQLNEFPSVSSIRLYGTHYSNSILKVLGRQTQITSLDLTLTSIDDDAIQVLRGWTHLRKLDLYGCSRLTSACVSDLLQMDFLDELSVLRTAIEDDADVRRHFARQFVEWEM